MQTAALNSEQVHQSVLKMCAQAKSASMKLAALSGEQQVSLLHDFAQGLLGASQKIVAANQQDLRRGEENGLSSGLRDRLRLDQMRIEQIAQATRQVAQLPTPVGKVVWGSRLANGIEVTRVRVPLGLVAMIYEARPNVTADAISLCLRSGNAVILRGGSAAQATNQEIVQVAQQVLVDHQLPACCVTSVDQYGRAGATALMRAKGLVDVLIPRGGAGLIQTCVTQSQVPVIETGTGNCHVYVDRSADLAMATKIVLNSKTGRPSVCNAAETLLVDQHIAPEALPKLLDALAQSGVKLHADQATLDLVAQLGLSLKIDLATQADYETEYLALEMAVALVDGVSGAISHITKYSSGHTEAIVANDIRAIQAFTTQVDSAAIAVNASTRFTDGGQLGLGAEIGISTQKLHARGPFALEELTTAKWIIAGQGQVRN